MPQGGAPGAGGLIFGWNGLSLMLKGQGNFISGCTPYNCVHLDMQTPHSMAWPVYRVVAYKLMHHLLGSFHSEDTECRQTRIHDCEAHSYAAHAPNYNQPVEPAEANGLKDV